MTGVFFASQNTFILRGKTTFAYPFIQFFLGQCLRGGEMFLIFLPIFFILSPNEFQEVYIMKFKKWIPGVMLGAMMAAMVTVPVMADNINSGSTPPR